MQQQESVVAQKLDQFTSDSSCFLVLNRTHSENGANIVISEMLGNWGNVKHSYDINLMWSDVFILNSLSGLQSWNSAKNSSALLRELHHSL